MSSLRSGAKVRALLFGSHALLIAACGLEVVGQAVPPGGTAPAPPPPGALPPPSGENDAGEGAEGGPIGTFCDAKDESALVLCLRFEQSFVDESPLAATITPKGSFQFPKARGSFGLRPTANDFDARFDAPAKGWTFEGLTIEAWVKTDLPLDGRRAVIDKNGFAGMFVTVNDELRCTAGVELAVGSVPSNVWTHLACVIGRDEVVAYINGAVVGKKVNEPLSLPGSAPVVIGKDSPEGNDRFIGVIDSIRVFGRAKTQDEIALAASE